MKRRRRKWPFFAAGVLCCSLGFVLYFQPTRKEKPSYSPPVEHCLTTWNGFTEYKRLKMLFEGFAIQSILDIPCMDVDQFQLGEIRYVGIASSKEKAQALQAQFGSHWRTFLHREITAEPLPKADLILSWDYLCTLKPSQVRAAIVQFKKSGAHFLLMRHFPEVEKNQKNRTGAFLPVNWTLPPYNFPEPLIHIVEPSDKEIQSLALWNLETI